MSFSVGRSGYSPGELCACVITPSVPLEGAVAVAGVCGAGLGGAADIGR